MKQILESSKKLGILYWYLCAVTVLFYVSILSLNVFLSSIIIEEYLPKKNDLLVN
jgi:hypothetical protein